MNPKNKLQEYLASKGLKLPQYHTTNVGTTVPSFSSTVVTHSATYTSSTVYPTKREAEFDAAQIAYDSLIRSSLFISPQLSKTKDSTYLINMVKDWFSSYNTLVQILNIKHTKTLQQKLLQACTHASFIVPHVQQYVQSTGNVLQPYNTFEILGDAVLGLIVCNFIIKHKHITDQGIITKKRIEYVKNSNLRSLMLERKLQKYILHDLSVQIENTSVPGDVLEAIIGVIFDEFGLDMAEHTLTTVFNLK